MTYALRISETGLDADDPDLKDRRQWLIRLKGDSLRTMIGSKNLDSEGCHTKPESDWRD